MEVKPLVSVVVACHGKCPELDGLMGCLTTQREYARVKRIHRPTGPMTLPLEIVLSSDGPYEAGVRHLDNPCVRLVTNRKEGGVGHATREPGIRAARGEWLVLTNADNLYASGWLSAIREFLHTHSGLVYWNMINSLHRYGNRGDVSLERGKIDLGCVAVRADIAKRVGFPFRNYDGDWDYIEACLNWCNKGRLRIQHVNQTLFIHN